MKKIPLIGLLLAICAVNGLCGTHLADIIRFASTDKAKELLLHEDEFTDSWSQFDIDSRMHKKNSTKEELLNYISTQAREWTTDETNKIQEILVSLDEHIAREGFNINFPDVIYFIKTTAAEEGGAVGYTRANYVVLKEDMVSRPDENLKHLIVHEIFHILTRNNPEFRKEMYQIIGFELINEIPYPENLKDYRITNPDAPQTDACIKLKVNDQEVYCMMLLYSDRDYDGGEFFKYLNVGFVELKGDAVKEIALIYEKPVMYTFKGVSNFYEQVGKNTQYIIHPEEILADNFAFAILNKSGLPNPEIVDKIKQILKE